jgi:hypothetical protein
LKNTTPRAFPASAALSRASASRSANTSETPRSASASVAAAASPSSSSRTSSSEKRWFRNLPVVLLSSSASRAPATPLLSAGISISDKRVFGSVRRRYPSLISAGSAQAEVHANRRAPANSRRIKGTLRSFSV